MTNEASQTDGNIDIAEELTLTLSELCRACQLPAEHILAFVEEGIVEPDGVEPQQWRFQSVCITRVHRARRLEHDLGINLAGVALALDLLEELEQVKARLRRLEGIG